MHGPSRASGGTITFTRDPSGRRASATGEVRSARRPSGADDPLDEKVDLRPARGAPRWRASWPARSIQTGPRPFTITSVTASSASSGSSGPRPVALAVTAARDGRDVRAPAGADALGVPRLAPDRIGDPGGLVVARGARARRRRAARVGTSGGTAELPGERAGQARGEQAGVDGPRDLRVDGDLGDHRRPHAVLDVGAGERSAGLRQQHDLGRPQRRRPSLGAARGSTGRVTRIDRVAPAATVRARTGRAGAAVGDHRPIVRRRAVRSSTSARSCVERTLPTREDREPVAGRLLEATERVGGDVATRRRASRRCPGPVGSGRPRAAGTSPARSTMRAPSGRAAGEQDGERGRDDRGAGATLR